MKCAKRLFAIFLSVIIMMNTLTSVVFADETEAVVVPANTTISEQEWEYSVSDGNATVTKYKGSVNDVIIPDTLDGYPVTVIGDAAFRECESLISVVIPNGIVKIGSRAFQNCRSLISITIPETVSSIGSYAFYNCLSLNDIVIPDAVSRIEDMTFRNCGSLTNVNLPDTVSVIGDMAFRTCTSLTGIVLPSNLISIGQEAFAHCISLTNITLPNSVSELGSGVFQECTALFSVTLSNGMDVISNNMFAGCSSLTSMTIPDSISAIQMDAFRGCTSLTDVIIPDSVTQLDSWAFAHCTSLESLTLGNGLKLISSRVFSDCISLTNISLSNSITKIDDMAFSGCSSLTKINIPDSVTEIGSEVFRNAGLYTNSPDGVVYADNWYVDYKGNMPEDFSLILKEGTRGIAYVSHFWKIASINMPESVMSIDNRTFRECINLKRVYFSGNVPANYETTLFEGAHSDFTIYYKSDTIGWTTPTWNGYRAYPSDILYEITVINGNAANTLAAVGEMVTITAETAPKGKVFNRWTSRDGVNFADANSTVTTFVLPAKNTTVTAEYKDLILPQATKSQLTYSLTDKTYNSKAQGVTVTPKAGVGNVTVKYNGSATVPQNAGTYTVTVDVAEGTSYAAASNIELGTFKINKAVPTKAQYTYSLNARTYNAKAQGITAAPKAGAGKVTAVYYGAAKTKPVNAGSYKITVDVSAGTNYQAAKNVVLGTFKINKASLSSAKITVADHAWTGKKIKPAKVKFNGVSLKVSAISSKITYGSNKNVGKGTIKITGKGNFKGTKSISFKVVPKKTTITSVIASSAGSAQMKVKWKTASSAQKVTKYQVRYRIKGSSKWKTTNFAASKSSGTIKKLTKGKAYEVQVRSLKKVKKATYYGAWSASKFKNGYVKPKISNLKYSIWDKIYPPDPIIECEMKYNTYGLEGALYIAVYNGKDRIFNRSYKVKKSTNNKNNQLHPKPGNIYLKALTNKNGSIPELKSGRTYTLEAYVKTDAGKSNVISKKIKIT